KFNAIIEDLEENKSTNQGDIKLIRCKEGIKYFRAKLSDRDRLLFKAMKHGDKDIFVILEVILNHDYRRSKFLTDEKKIENIKIISKEVSDTAGEVEIGDAPQVRWLGKFITFSAKQEEIVKNASNLPLVVSGSAGSGKTSVALEKLRKIEEEFKEGRILYITKSENLIKKSKELYECEYYADNKLKTGVPEQIEFLSLHEFIKRITKEDEGIRSRVEGKKPIDRNAFLSWFNKKFQEDKKYKKDGNKIFEEFIAVIGGGGLLGENGKDLYMELGKRESIFPKEKRGNIYGLFEEYKKFIEGSSEYYDTSLIAHECVEKVQANYDAVVVDEVQDLTKSTLKLILKSLKDDYKNDFLLCGDVNQVIHPSFFSISRLKSFLHEDGGYNRGLQVCTLEKNYRNSKQVIEFANRILHLKNYCFASEDKMTEGEKKAFFMKSGTENPGNVGFIAKGDEQKIAGKISESTNWAVLVLNDESKEDARKLFKTPLVFSIQEAKGLEFENVILYKFVSHGAYNKIWNVACPSKDQGKVNDTIKKIRNSFDEGKVNPSRAKDKEDKSFEEHKFYMNALYVGITRAIDNVYIIDDEKKCNLLKVIKPEKEGHKNIKKEESSSEAWRDMALRLIDEGNIEQAKNIAIEKLPDKKEYAEEIVDVLKARGYNKEAKEINDQLKLSLDKDKSEQTMRSSPESEIDIENLSSRFSEECSMDDTKPGTSAKNSDRKQGKKRIANPDQNEVQGSRNKDQEKEPLKRNKESRHIIRTGKLKKIEKSQYSGQRLSLANNSSNLRLIDNLAERGKIFQGKSSSSKETCLHAAAQNGYAGMVKSLLENGADANAVKEGWTSLCLGAERGHYKIVVLLLDHGAIVDLANHGVWTPLHLAASRGHDKVVKLLLDKGAKVDATTKEGCTPLHVAAQEGKKDVVVLLLDHGADVKARNQKGITPLHGAAGIGHYAVVELLLDKGADANAEAEKGYTPLHVAAQEGKKDVAELLLKNGADVNAKTSDDYTPLRIAAENGYDGVVDLLLANPNINVGCIQIGSLKNGENKEKIRQKFAQDYELFGKVKEAANEKDTGKLDELLKEIKKSLEPESKCDFKPSLNYSPNGNDENTTIEIAIEAGGKLLKLLYDYAEKNIGVDTKIFKQLKDAKEQENSQLKSNLCDAFITSYSAQAQGL
ncbi:MAG: ankyrin repeat domain-containing protein, partial [Wolbachia sp.]